MINAQEVLKVVTRLLCGPSDISIQGVVVRYGDLPTREMIEQCPPVKHYSLDQWNGCGTGAQSRGLTLRLANQHMTTAQAREYLAGFGERPAYPVELVAAANHLVNYPQRFSVVALNPDDQYLLSVLARLQAFAVTVGTGSLTFNLPFVYDHNYGMGERPVWYPWQWFLGVRQ